MFLVQKIHLTSHFKLKKPSPIPKGYQLAAQSFDEKVNFHLKNLIPAADSSAISLAWMSKAVSFLSVVHFEALEQVSNLGSESDWYNTLYMDYSRKVLDLSNLISSAIQRLTERRLLLNLSLRLLNSSGQIPSTEKLKKAKDALTRPVNESYETRNDSTEKAQRAKDLLVELSQLISAGNNLPLGKTGSARDLIRRTLHGLGALTVFVSSVLVSVLYGESDYSDLVDFRVPAEFLWSDSVTDVQKQVSDLLTAKQASDGGEKKRRRLLELEDTAIRAVAVCDVIDEVVSGGDGGGGDEQCVRLENGVKELRAAAAKFSDGVGEFTNGVNGLFGSVLKRRNDVLNGVRKCDW